MYSYLEFLRTLEEKVDSNWAEISSSLEEIRQSLLSRKNCLINITADGKNLTKSEKFIGNFLDFLPNQSALKNSTWNARLSSENEAIVIPTQVSAFFLSVCFAQFCLNYLLIATSSRLITLEKQPTFMKLAINLMEVPMLFQSLLVILGYGTVFE